jgi:hypothetical protein
MERRGHITLRGGLGRLRYYLYGREEGDVGLGWGGGPGQAGQGRGVERGIYNRFLDHHHQVFGNKGL